MDATLTWLGEVIQTQLIFSVRGNNNSKETKEFETNYFYVFNIITGINETLIAPEYVLYYIKTAL